MNRRNLVIVRAGDKSLHPDWLAGNAPRSWDIVVNYFGSNPDTFRGDDVTVIHSNGPKWPALYELLVQNPQFIDDYDHIWLPDDDLKIDKAGINRLFEICTEHKLEVAQPALTWDSYFGHITTLQNRNYKLRFTNYVEVMAPCFSSAMLKRSLPMMNSNLSGWGLDFIWVRLSERPKGGIAIVDAVSMRHTRPVGGPNYAKLREGGISPWDELRTFCRTYGLDEAPEIATHKAIRHNGKVVGDRGGPRGFLMASVLEYSFAVMKTPEPNRMMRRLAGMAYKACRNIPDRVSELPLRARRGVAKAPAAPGYTSK